MIVAGIPAYNEEKTIARVILLAQKHVDVVVVCDDGSQDLTGDISQRLGAVVIRHERNMGYGAAIQSLFEKAKTLNADLLLTLDADGQHDAQEIPKLLKPIMENKADIVLGSRFLVQSHAMPRYRRFGVRILTRITNGSKKSAITDAQCGFRIYNRKAIESLALDEKGMGVSAEVLMKARALVLTVAEVPVQVHYHGLETSTHNPIMHGLNVIGTILRVVVEERPLVFLGIPGMVLILVGLSMGVWALQLYTSGVGLIVSIALIASSLFMIGLFTMFTAITLYAIIRLSEKQRTRKS